jgi:hypothetical protein
MPETGTDYEDAVAKLFDTISDEIEIARGAEQLATNLVDRLSVEREPRIDAMDLLPLQVILTRHVASLEQILEAYNVL